MTRRGSWLALAVGVAFLPAAHRAASQKDEREDVEGRQAGVRRRLLARRRDDLGEVLGLQQRVRRGADRFGVRLAR